ncbi:MAG: 16S rRNA (adenine(1518)-N(6)/adenine(1519)-N(6))-dimethyltransferase RsmA [Phycisphaerae bacterium]
MDRSEITQILASAGLRPQHQFGQNFMVDQTILHAIADAGDIHPDDVILEVGPGVGNLTRLLAQRAARGAVLAVDIDYKLMPAAQRHHAGLTNVTWINTDVLAGKHEVEPAVIQRLRDLRTAHPNGHLKLVSNLPYNAASPLIAELLVEMWKDQHHRNSAPAQTSAPSPKTLFFERLAFTVQYEVAQRMAAKPATRDYGPLGILIQSMATVQIVRKIPPGAFWPPPKIHSALVLVQPQLDKIARIQNAPALQLLLQGIFSHRRQTLGNALKHHLGDRWPELKKIVTAANFDLLKRGEELPLESFLKLAELTTPAP